MNLRSLTKAEITKLLEVKGVFSPEKVAKRLGIHQSFFIDTDAFGEERVVATVHHVPLVEGQFSSKRVMTVLSRDDLFSDVEFLGERKRALADEMKRLLEENPGEPDDWSDPAKLRLLASLHESRDIEEGRVETEVQDDLKRIANRIEELGDIW